MGSMLDAVNRLEANKIYAKGAVGPRARWRGHSASVDSNASLSPTECESSGGSIIRPQGGGKDQVKFSAAKNDGGKRIVSQVIRL
jgi:hypothetical protein